jgi:DNA-binding HxlR family transcriptional regulator
MECFAGFEALPMSQPDYPSFCPVAMAAEMIEPRWTLLILSEMWAGSKRFGEIQSGVPGMSPSLLSKRLKDMETKGLVRRTSPAGSRRDEYLTTAMANELQPIVRALGEWAHRNVECEVSLKHLDARLLMWNIRRKIDRLELPLQRCTIQFSLDEPSGEKRTYWLVFRPGLGPDLCFTDPGRDVDLFIFGSLRSLTSAWMGHSSFEAEIAAERITLIGHEALARSLTRWLIRSSYAGCGASSRRATGVLSRAAGEALPKAV